jgi:hypothetical protein
MDAEQIEAAAGGWMGEGLELTRRILAYADIIRQHGIPTSGAGAQAAAATVASDLELIVKREWNPRV